MQCRRGLRRERTTEFRPKKRNATRRSRPWRLRKVEEEERDSYGHIISKVTKKRTLGRKVVRGRSQLAMGQTMGWWVSTPGRKANRIEERDAAQLSFRS